MKSEPDWPEKFPHNCDDEYTTGYNRGYNNAINTCITAFNKWRKEQEKEGKT